MGTKHLHHTPSHGGIPKFLIPGHLFAINTIVQLNCTWFVWTTPTGRAVRSRRRRPCCRRRRPLHESTMQKLQSIHEARRRDSPWIYIRRSIDSYLHTSIMCTPFIYSYYLHSYYLHSMLLLVHQEGHIQEPKN
jgi:hypothetical protein